MNSRAPAPPPLLRGFSFVRHLGSGGFADVYLYTEQNLGRRNVAVKVLIRGKLADDALHHFGSEATLMARLSNHPSIVSVYQAGISIDDRPFIVMEYCSKPTLHARYRATRLSEAETLRVGIQIAGAVETAHRAGILHRDIKPANILVTDYGRPALADFGIAATTGSGTAVGLSVPWAPPEALGAGWPCDARSDVYSLAATLYTVLAGRTPFEILGGSNTQTELIGRIQEAPLPRLGRTDVLPSVDRVLAAGMARDPQDRFPSAIAFARALQRVQIERGMQPTMVDVMDDAVDSEELGEEAGRTVTRPVVAIDARIPTAPAVHPQTVSVPIESVPVFGAGIGQTILRPASDEAAVTQLRDAMGGSSTQSLAPTRSDPTTPRHARRPRRLAMIGGVTAVAVAAAVGIASILLPQESAVPRSSGSLTPMVSAEPMAATASASSGPSDMSTTTRTRSASSGSPAAVPPGRAVAGFTCWNGKTVGDLKSCGRPTGIEGLRYLYPSLKAEWSRCKYLDLRTTTATFECSFDRGVIRYRYWKDAAEATGHYVDKYANADESEFVLDGQSLGTVYRDIKREKEGVFWMTAQWGDGHYALSVAAKTRAEQEQLWATARIRAVADLQGFPRGTNPREAVRE